jgi:hypothetical protein
MTLSLENRCLVLFEAIAISSRGYDSDQKWIGSVYDISCWAGLTSRHDKLGVVLLKVSSSSGIGGDDKDLIVRTNLGGRIAHESDSVDVASESGRQTHLV